MDWIQLARDREQQGAAVNPGFHKGAANMLTSWETISFAPFGQSIRVLLQGQKMRPECDVT
jgi:hypothetical protein